MAKWAYEFQVAPREPFERGELTASSEEEARRKLRVLLRGYDAMCITSDHRVLSTPGFDRHRVR